MDLQGLRAIRYAGGKDLGVLLPGVLFIFTVSLVLSVYWTRSAAQFAFYAMPSRMWQLSLGAIVCLVLYRRRQAGCARSGATQC